MASSRKTFNALARALGISSGKMVTNSLHKNNGKNKFNARITVVDGYKFRSKKEALYYSELKIKKQTNLIKDFDVFPYWILFVQEKVIGRYTADFRVFNLDGSVDVIDVKGGKATITEAYKLRKRLMKAIYNIEIIEV